jgi:hypothetical protein
MSETENLDLSKVTVSDLLNDKKIPDSTESVEEVPKEKVEESTEAVDNTEEVQEEASTEEKSSENESVEEPVLKETEGETEGEKVTENSKSEEDSELSIIQTLKERLGYEIDGEFADDYDGIIGLTKATATKMAEEQFGQVFAAFPDVKEYMNYRVAGGSPTEYFEVASKEMDFSNMQVNEKDKGMQRKVVETFLDMQGYEPEEIQDTIQDYEDANLLFKNASRAVKKIAAVQVKQKETLLKTQENEAKTAATQTQQTWKEIGEIINKGKLRDFTIPEAEKKKFYNWMATPIDKNGRSQRLVDRQKMDQESILAMEFLVYKGLDLSKLINTKATTRQAVNLKTKLKASTQTASRRMKGNKGGYNRALSRTTVPTLEKLFG